MDILLTKEQNDFRQIVRDFGEKVIKPKTAELDSETYPWWLRDKEIEAGFFKRWIPKEYGGDGGTIMDVMLIEEELAKFNVVASGIIQTWITLPLAWFKFANDEQKRKYLPAIATGDARFAIGMTERGAGSSLTDLTTTAVLDDDHYVVNGGKCFTSYFNICTHIITFVRFHPEAKGARGIGAIIIDKDTPGLKVVAREPTLAASVGGGVEWAEEFNDCRVPRENVLAMGEKDNTMGFKTGMMAYNASRLGRAAFSVGQAHRALELAIDYSKERVQFGRPICEFQGIQWMLADMYMKIEGARALLYKAAKAAEFDPLGLPPYLETAVAKVVADTIVFEVADSAVQIFGGKGYTAGNPIGAIWLRARLETIGGGTVQTQKNAIASAILGRKFSQRRE
jgi:alkylation response protein AidB-like acyl-CoA dehydrogenase